MVGKVLGNRYEILERLGGGGMAIVYKGRDTMLNRLVTIKVLRPEYTSDEDFVRRFRREARSVASLSHPNIVNIYDVGQESDVYYLVMEYIDGENLKTLIKREGPLPLEKALQFAGQICDALDHAHENNIVHRDVKPHNILITKTGRAKLTDFGIALEAGTATMTSTDTILGSVHYISPEQAKGEQAGAASDIYSMGIVLYEMLTGRVPFTGDSPIAIALCHVQNTPELPSKLRPGIPAGVEKVVLKALSKEPQDRFPTAGEMSQVLKRYGAWGEDDGATRLIPLDEDATRVISGLGETLKTREQHSIQFEQRPRERQNQVARRNSEIMEPFEDNRESSYTGRNRQKRSKVGWILALVVLGLLIGGGAFAWNYVLNVPEIEMPEVLGMTKEEAKKELVAKGFNLEEPITWQEGFEENKEPDQVIAQDPKPHEKVKANAKITLTINQGEELIPVPNLYNKPLEEATRDLTKSNLKVKEPPSYDYNDQVGKGLIYNQIPAAGEEVSKDTEITVYISKGKKELVAVPYVLQLSENEAMQKLTEANLTVGESKREDSTEYFNGQVIHQEPVAETMVEKGSSVVLTISNGPGLRKESESLDIRVPNDGRPHIVRIEVSDLKDSNRLEYEKTRKPSERSQFTVTVDYYGEGLAAVYIDDILAIQQTLNSKEHG